MKKCLLFIWLSCLSISLLAKTNHITSVPDSFVYHQAGKFSLKAYVFQPIADSKRHPAILLFHGGAWRLGDASWTFGRAKEFADNGMVAICIEYRLANSGA